MKRGGEVIASQRNVERLALALSVRVHWTRTEVTSLTIAQALRFAGYLPK